MQINEIPNNSYITGSINLCIIPNDSHNQFITPGHRSGIGFINDGLFEYIRSDTVDHLSLSYIIAANERKRMKFNTYKNSSGQYRINYGIFNNKYAFAALRNDGRVCIWGGEFGGGGKYPDNNNGHSGLIPDSYVSNIVQIYSTQAAFTAVRNDGRVCIWGDSSSGGAYPHDTDISGLIPESDVSNICIIANNFIDYRLIIP